MTIDNAQRYFDAAYALLARENLESAAPSSETDSFICEVISDGLEEYLDTAEKPTVAGFLTHLKIPRPFLEKETKNKYIQRIEYTVEGMGGINHITIARYLDLETGNFTTPRFYWVTCLEDLPIQTVANFHAALNSAIAAAKNWTVSS